MVLFIVCLQPVLGNSLEAGPGRRVADSQDGDGVGEDGGQQSLGDPGRQEVAQVHPQSLQAEIVVLLP